MKVSEIVTWARSLANLSSSKAIGYDDESKSVNASWRDLYARLLESNDDYYSRALTITITAGMSSGTNEYTIPLPEDFFRLRALDWMSSLAGGQWFPMERFPLSERDDQPSVPKYRIENGNLWVVGQNVAQIRIRYYPPEVELTHPGTDLQYATAVAPNSFPLVSSPVYAAWKNTGVYIYSSQNIVEGSIDDNTVGSPVTLLAAGVNLSNLAYYKGYLYWIQAGNVKRAPTDLKTSPIVPANIIATGTVTSFAIFKDLLYYCDNSVMKTAALDGTGPATLLAAAGTWLCSAGGVVFYVSAGALKSIVPSSTVIASGVSACTSDGTKLYLLDTSGNLRVLIMAAATIVTNLVLETDVASIGPWASDRIPLLTAESQKMLAVSSTVDTNISYPVNVVQEIISYQAAIDFKTKIGEDITQLALRLGHPSGEGGPATGLWARFEKTVRRDDYKPERISNSRRSLREGW
jgi:hypothetical protein